MEFGLHWRRTGGFLPVQMEHDFSWIERTSFERGDLRLHDII